MPAGPSLDWMEPCSTTLVSSHLWMVPSQEKLSNAMFKSKGGRRWVTALQFGSRDQNP